MCGVIFFCNRGLCPAESVVQCRRLFNGRCNLWPILKTYLYLEAPPNLCKGSILGFRVHPAQVRAKSKKNLAALSNGPPTSSAKDFVHATLGVGAATLGAMDFVVVSSLRVEMGVFAVIWHSLGVGDGVCLLCCARGFSKGH